MRTFSNHEQEIIHKIISIDKGKIITLNSFLKEFFFTEDLGRALIIQTLGRYAIFFLKTELFDDPLRKKEELDKFKELISLITYLKQHKYISIFRDEKSKEKPMFFIQDGFVGAHRFKKIIILNTNGEFTSNPDTIHDKSGKITYKGLLNKGEDYEKILSCTTGSLIISKKINTILDENSVTKEKTNTLSTKPKKNNITNKVQHRLNMHLGKLSGTKIIQWFSMITLFILIAFSAFLYHQYSSLVAESVSLKKNVEIHQSKINELSLKTERYDSLFSNQKIKPINETVSKTYYGIDVTKWNGNVLSLIQKKDSISFIIIKATEGIRLIDTKFKKNWKFIRSNNYILGAYHFYLTNDNPIKQAEHFWSTISSQGTTDIAPIVDIEQGSLSKDTNSNQTDIQNNLLIFLNHLEKKCNRVPMIYTNVAFANEYLHNKSFSKYPLWLSEYTTDKEPRLPITWKENGYKIWQKSHNYAIDSHKIDYDIYYGNISDLVK